MQSVRKKRMRGRNFGVGGRWGRLLRWSLVGLKGGSLRKERGMGMGRRRGKERSEELEDVGGLLGDVVFFNAYQ